MSDRDAQLNRVMALIREPAAAHGLSQVEYLLAVLRGELPPPGEPSN